MAAAHRETKHRKILRKAMEKEGFVQRPNEWWHYDYKRWQQYAIMNTPFDQISDVVHRVGEGISVPKLISSRPPEFTDEARRSNIRGTVFLSFVVGADGTPRDIYLERGPGFGFDEAAIAALKKWVFQPAMANDKPVPVAVTAEISFY